MKQKQKRIRTGDLTLIKELNSAIVLNCIRRNQPISRAGVARMCGLNRATVSSIVAELIDGHLVVEAGIGASCGGRKPIMLRFNAAAALVIGVEIGVNFAAILACDLEGRVCARKTVAFPAALGVGEVMRQVVQSTKELLKETSHTPLGLAGIGVGVPGFVQHSSGNLVFAPNLNWRDVVVANFFSETFDCPVLLENEANAGALGEMWFGSAKGSDDFIYLSVGVGLGAGVVLNGELFRGSDGYAGEMGHTTLDPAGPLCSCGNRGCWETLASETALLRYAGEAGLTLPSSATDGITGFREKIEALAAAGDAAALAAYARTGAYLGTGIANAVNIFNPTLVVIGNSMASGLQYMNAVIQETVRQKALPRLSSRVRIIPAALKDNCALGGAAMVLQEMLQIPKLAQKVYVKS